MVDVNPPFKLSRESLLRIDREGHFWHDGTRVEHARLERALACWVDLEDATGRFILKNEVQWCYVEVDDAPLVVRNLWLEGASVELELSDGSHETLVFSTLRVDEDDVLYCDVRHGRLPARFDRSSAYKLMQHADLGPDGRITLRLGHGEDTEVVLVPRGEGRRRFERASRGVASTAT